MKKLIGVSLALMSLNVFANELPEYYAAQFRIVRVLPNCTRAMVQPGSKLNCQTMGGKIIVEATVGCTDKVVFTQFEELVIRDTAVVHAVSLVRKDDNNLVRCFAPQFIRKELPVSLLNRNGKVELENIEIQTR